MNSNLSKSSPLLDASGLEDLLDVESFYLVSGTRAAGQLLEDRVHRGQLVRQQLAQQTDRTRLVALKQKQSKLDKIKLVGNIAKEM